MLIHVGASGVYETITPNDNNYIILEPHEFDCTTYEYCIRYDRVGTRLAYAYLYARDYGDGDNLMQTLLMVVYEHTGATKIYMADEEGLPYVDCPDLCLSKRGYIDDPDIHTKYLFKDPALLKAFIFDKDSTIETKNDRSNNYRFHLGI